MYLKTTKRKHSRNKKWIDKLSKILQFCRFLPHMNNLLGFELDICQCRYKYIHSIINAVLSLIRETGPIINFIYLIQLPGGSSSKKAKMKDQVEPRFVSSALPTRWRRSKPLNRSSSNLCAGMLKWSKFIIMILLICYKTCC